MRDDPPFARRTCGTAVAPDQPPAARRRLRRRLAFAVARRCQGASTARVPRPDITARVERCNAATFSMTMRLYSAGVQVSRAIIEVRRAIVSHDTSIISAIIKGSARLRRRIGLRMVPKTLMVTTAQVAVGQAVSRCSRIALRAYAVSRRSLRCRRLARVKSDRDRGVYTRCKALGFGVANSRRKRKTKDTERRPPSDVH
jgi:hypothetical protein